MLSTKDKIDHNNANTAKSGMNLILIKIDHNKQNWLTLTLWVYYSYHDIVTGGVFS
jgi:hypothetical protein